MRLWVNGEEVSGGTNCQPATGFLCLESEGAPVEFKNLRIRELLERLRPRDAGGAGGHRQSRPVPGDGARRLPHGLPPLIGELPQDQSNDRAHDTKYIKTRMSAYAFFETDKEKEKTPKS